MPDAESVRVSVTPSKGEAVIVVEADDPITALTELGDADKANDPMIRFIVVVRVMRPSVPVIVIGYCPEAALLLTERLRFEEDAALKLTMT